MESLSPPRPPALRRAIAPALIATLMALAGIGWVAADELMRGMDAGPGTHPGTLGFYTGAWVVMMAAMMFPSIYPMVVMYARVQDGRRKRAQDAPAGATASFVAGYLVTWAAAGLAFYAVIVAGRALDFGLLAWDRGGPYVAGGVILAAAAYQLTPLKDACLSKCRSPLGFLVSAWRPGRVGALRMGIEHGGWCVGCCWALMAALFALGVMSIGWMVFIAALIATEKLLPWKAVANRGLAILLVALGLAVAFVPEDVPGLTLPDQASMGTIGIEGGAMDRGSGGGFETGSP